MLTAYQIVGLVNRLLGPSFASLPTLVSPGSSLREVEAEDGGLRSNSLGEFTYSSLQLTADCSRKAVFPSFFAWQTGCPGLPSLSLHTRSFWVEFARGRSGRMVAWGLSSLCEPTALSHTSSADCSANSFLLRHHRVGGSGQHLAVPPLFIFISYALLSFALPHPPPSTIASCDVLSFSL